MTEEPTPPESEAAAIETPSTEAKAGPTAGNEVVVATPTDEERLQEEMEQAKNMKIGELKVKLQAMGVLIGSFCEKSELVQAYAEAMFKKSKQDAIVVEDGLHAAAPNPSDEDDEDDDEDNNPMSDMPAYVTRRVDKLIELNDEREKAMEEYLKERAQLEAKYQALCKPLYDKRSEIVRGVMDEDIAKDHSDEAGGNGEKMPGIPQFWVCALGHMGVVAQLIAEQDLECLEFLQDVTCNDDESGEGFTLGFHFAPNDYFHDIVLTKRYIVPNLLLADEPILKKVEGCKIQWKPGQSLTHTKVIKKQRGKGKNIGQIRSSTAEEHTDSFFDFFQPPKMPSLETMDEEEAERIEHAFSEDYDIAQAFRSHIIPKAVLWFTGQVSIWSIDCLF
jgi:nucleosome assembly protein 1-like 1